MSRQDANERLCQQPSYSTDYMKREMNFLLLKNWLSKRGLSIPRQNWSDNSKCCGSSAKAISAHKSSYEKNADLKKSDVKIPSPLNDGEEKMKYTSASKGGDEFKLLARSLTKVELSAKLLEFEVEGDYQFFLTMIQDLATVSNINDLSQQAVNNLTIITEAAEASIFLFRGQDKNRLATTKTRSMESSKIVEDCNALFMCLGIHGQVFLDNTEKNWISKICEYVASTGDVINLEIPQKDSRFHETVEGTTKYQTYSLLCLPVMNGAKRIIAVAQIMNKAGTRRFTKVDEEVCKMYMEFFGLFLFNVLTVDRLSSQ